MARGLSQHSIHNCEATDGFFHQTADSSFQLMDEHKIVMGVEWHNTKHVRDYNNKNYNVFFIVATVMKSK